MVSWYDTSLLAMQFKGFSEWEPRVQAIVTLVGGVVFLVALTTFVRRLGWWVILIPAVFVGVMYFLNKNAGCMRKAARPGDLVVVEQGSHGTLGDRLKPKQSPDPEQSVR